MHARFLIVFVAACGGPTASTSATKTTDLTAASGPTREAATPTDPAELRSEALRLREAVITGWQSPPPEAALAAACEQAEHHLIAARLVSDAAPPAGVDAAAWRAAGEALVEAAGGLDGGCFQRAEDPSGVPSLVPALTALHDAVAQVLALAPGIVEGG